MVIVPYDSDGRIGPWEENDTEMAAMGAEAWIELGFIYLQRGVNDLPYEGEMDRCPRDWSQQRITECAIPVGVTREAFLIERYGVVGLANRADRTIIIDSRFHFQELRGISAHEFGHILLNSSRHLAPGDRGIMMPNMNEYLQPTEDDYRLACETTEICEGGN